MAKGCVKCGNSIPKAIWVDGKKRNLQRRKYCLTCSPFGSHNTSKLEERAKNGSKVKNCPDCGKKHDQKGRRCFACYFRHKSQLRADKVYAVTGEACWFCGYNKTRHNLCFHHVNPKTKNFQLSTRELILRWDRVLTEMKKCVLACHNCHGEIHCGLIADKKVQRVWKSRWRP